VPDNFPFRAPTAPTGLTATLGNASISLTWTAPGGATTYNVYGGATSGSQGTTVSDNDTRLHTHIGREAR
jgi:hypothetical protein